MNRRIVGLAAVFILAAAAFAGEMKSDPANYYLDPEEIRPYVLEELKGFLPSWMGKGHPFGHLTAFDVRLVEGQLPLYTIEGDVAAYIYIAYVVPGPLPTLEDIVGNARAGMEVYADFDESHFRAEPFDLIGAFAERYPYEFTCVHAIVGVNEEWPYGEYCAHVPTIILRRPAGEDAARNYYGSDGFKFVRYIYCSNLQGYEFTDGETDIVVPVDRFGTVDEDLIKTRADIDTRLEEYIRKTEPENVKMYFRKWEYFLSAESGLGRWFPPVAR